MGRLPWSSPSYILQQPRLSAASRPRCLLVDRYGLATDRCPYSRNLLVAAAAVFSLYAVKSGKRSLPKLQATKYTLRFYTRALICRSMSICEFDESRFAASTLDMLILKIVALDRFTATPLRSVSSRYRGGPSGPTGVSLPGAPRLENRGWMKADWRSSKRARGEILSLTREGAKQLNAENETGSVCPKRSGCDADSGVTTMSWINGFGSGTGWRGTRQEVQFHLERQFRI